MWEVPAIAAENSSNPCLDLSDSMPFRVVSDDKFGLRTLDMKKIEFIKLKMEIEKA